MEANEMEMQWEKEREVACPTCGKVHKVITYDRIIAPQQNELKSRLMKNELFRFTCEDCDTSMPLIYPLLYQDMEKGYMIWFAPASEGEMQGKLSVFNEKAKDEETYRDMMQQYKLRMVTNVNALIEKILIFDEELDDRSVEVQKAMLVVQLQNVSKYKDDSIHGVFFERLREHGYAFSVVLEKAGVVTVNFDMDQYYKVHIRNKKLLEEKTPDGFALIQSKWASERFAEIIRSTKPAKGKKYRKF